MLWDDSVGECNKWVTGPNIFENILVQKDFRTICFFGMPKLEATILGCK